MCVGRKGFAGVIERCWGHIGQFMLMTSSRAFSHLEKLKVGEKTHTCLLNDTNERKKKKVFHRVFNQRTK
jgi:hypothetical protein